MCQELEAYGFAGADADAGAFAIGAALQSLTGASVIAGSDKRIVCHGRIWECAFNTCKYRYRFMVASLLSDRVSLNPSLQESCPGIN
jgi:hypothetical protein